MNDYRCFKALPIAIAVLALQVGCGTGGTDDGSDRRSCTELEGSGALEGGVVLDDDCYSVASSLTVTSGEVEVPAGTVLYFDADTGLSLEQSARLTAVGSDSAPVEFRGDTSELGYWKGIRLDSSGPHQLRDVVIADGGSTEWNDEVPIRRGGLVISANSADVEIENATFEQHEFAAVVTDAALAEVDISETRFEHNDAPMRLHPNQVDGLGGGNSFSEHRHDAVFVHGDEPVSRNGSWSPQSVAYRIEEVVAVESNLTIEPDTVVEFERHAGLDFDGGTLSIDAVSGARVRLQGSRDSAGYWRGLRFRDTPSSRANELRNVEIRHAGSQPWDDSWSNSQAALLVHDGGHLVINDAYIADSDYHGISVRDGLVEGCDGLEFDDIYRHATHSYEEGETCG